MAISKIFKKDLQKNSTMLKYDDFYVDYLIDSFLMKKNGANFYEISDFLEKIYYDENIFASKLKDKLSKYEYMKRTKLYSISNHNYFGQIIEIIDLLDKINQKIDYNFSLNSKFDNKLNVEDNTNTIINTIALRLSIDLKENDCNETKAKIIKFYLHKDEYIQQSSELLNLLKLTQHCSGMPLEWIFHDDKDVELLSNFEIKNVHELYKINPLIFVSLFFNNYENLFNNLKLITFSPLEIWKKVKDKIFSLLKYERLSIYIDRNKNNPNKMTLEEIGYKNNLTRERIRQIEKKTQEKIILISKKLSLQVKIIFDSILLKNNSKKDYLSIFDLDLYFKKREDTLIFLSIVDSADTSIKYNSEFDILYDSNSFSLNLFIDEVLDDYKISIKKETYEQLPNIYQKIINTKYRYKSKENIYLIKGLGKKEIVYMIIRDYFPNGYHISNIDDLNLMSKKISQIYDINEEISIHRLLAVIDRTPAILIDKGTYSALEHTVNLDDEFSNEIINYINSISEPVIYYSSIYEKFKEQLQKRGINNYFYLKGLLDSKLPENMHKQRNFINLDQGITSGRDTMQKWILSRENIFNYQDFLISFPGVKEYTFYQILYSMENEVMFLPKKKFKTIVELELIDNITLQKFKDFIINLIDESEDKTIKSSKVYAEMYWKDEELLKKLKFVSDEFSLFSLAKIVLKNDLSMQRPWFALKKEDLFNNQNDLLYRHFLNKVKVTKKEVKNYCSDLNIPLDNFLSFIENLSSNFVQVDLDILINKKNLDFDNFFLSTFQNKLNFILDKVNLIDTKSFDFYHLFPKLKGFVWNEYLLVGLIRTFFVEEYSIINTNSQHNLTHFKIKKVKEKYE